MGQTVEAGAAGLAVALISPFEIWCAGVETLARSRGWRFVGCLPCGLANVAFGVLSQLTGEAEVLLIANRLLARPDGAGRRPRFGQAVRGGVVAVIEPDDPFTMEDFLALDVAGMVLSSASFDELGHCIESVGMGGRWVDPGIRELLRHDPDQEAPCDLLSDRELQVAVLAAAGRSNKEIARELGVSDGTVKMHMHHVLGKLKVESRMGLRGIQWLHNSGANDRRHSDIEAFRQSLDEPTFF